MCSPRGVESHPFNSTSIRPNHRGPRRFCGARLCEPQHVELDRCVGSVRTLGGRQSSCRSQTSQTRAPQPGGLPEISRGSRSAATIPPVSRQTNLLHPEGCQNTTIKNWESSTFRLWNGIGINGSVPAIGELRTSHERGPSASRSDEPTVTVGFIPRLGAADAPRRGATHESGAVFSIVAQRRRISWRIEPWLEIQYVLRLSTASLARNTPSRFTSAQCKHPITAE